MPITPDPVSLHQPGVLLQPRQRRGLVPLTGLLATSLWLAACVAPATPPPTAPPASATAAAPAEPWVADARQVAASVPPRLLKALTKEIDIAGPEGAIGACRDLAPALARAASAESGWAVRRVSLRERNPKAVPDAWERGVLAEFDRIAAARGTAAPIEHAEVVATADGKRERRYMRALPTQELCLACHGARASLSAGVTERLRTLYPADRAVDYRVGEIRGAMTLRQAIP
jgi:hypothetical protein